jgi:malonyl-CoA/methylmalonyl-CoA synthetase
MMINCWQWTMNDSVIHTLPLNHFSGLVYSLLTPFYVGAQCEVLPKFNVETVWNKLLDTSNSINLYIGVPTIYVQMVDYYLNNKEFAKAYPVDKVQRILKNKMRIIGTGSAALNVKTYMDWYNITNYPILERYGMTEIGMALSNPYKETDKSKRIAGTVGRPCGDQVQVRIMKENQKVLVQSDEKEDKIFVDTKSEDIFGELQVKGNVVFKEYYGKPEQTRETFTQDGWFKTGFLNDQTINFLYIN